MDDLPFILVRLDIMLDRWLWQHITARFTRPDHCDILCACRIAGERFSFSLFGGPVRQNGKLTVGNKLRERLMPPV